jgi:putative oxidoreductase
MNYFENACLLSGRTLMGLYFILPAITKITGFENMSVYMAAHNVPMVPVLLVMTIVIQLSAGSALILGFKGKWAAFLLAGLVLVISLFMHNFWDYADGTERAHELQNFFKNMGIVAGLLVIAALGTGRFSLDQRLSS